MICDGVEPAPGAARPRCQIPYLFIVRISNISSHMRHLGFLRPGAASEYSAVYSAVYTWDYYPPYFNIHAPIANNRMLPGYKNIYCINYCASQAVPRRRESRAGPALSYYFSGLWMGHSCSLSSFRFNWMLIKSQHREPRDRLTAAILCWENNYFI